MAIQPLSQHLVDPATAVVADGILTATANADEGDTVTIGIRVYTFTATVDDTNKILIGGSASDTLDNFIAAVNGDAGAGTLYGSGTDPHADVTAAAGAGDTVDVDAKVLGAAGNLIATTSVSTPLTWGDPTLVNGVDASEDGANNYAVTAARFFIKPPVGKKFAIGTLAVQIRLDAGGLSYVTYTAAVLTNGVIVQRATGDPTDVPSITVLETLTPSPILVSGDYVVLEQAGFLPALPVATTNHIALSLRLPGGGVSLSNLVDEMLMITLNDNLSTLTGHKLTAIGHQEDEILQVPFL